MRKIILSLALVLFSTASLAGPGSVLGGKALPDRTVHSVTLGWPSMGYEWWNAGGNMDWAIGAELVYGDWSGEFSDMDIGFAMNVPFRWHLQQNGRAHIGLKFAPGAVIGSSPGDTFVAGVRGEMGVPITIDINEQVNVITGVSVPFTIMFYEGVDAYAIIPIMPRIGVEFAASRGISPFVLMELGPVIAVGDFGSEVDFGVRAYVGSMFF